MTQGDLSLDDRMGRCAVCAGTIQEIAGIDVWIFYRRRAAFVLMIRSAFYDKMPLREILEQFRQWLAAIERLSNCRGIHGRQLEKIWVPTERIAVRILSGYCPRNWLAETTETPNLRASESTVSRPESYVTKFCTSST